MDVQDFAFLLSRVSFPPHVLKLVVEVKASGTSHVPKMWFVVSNDMLPVK